LRKLTEFIRSEQCNLSQRNLDRMSDFLERRHFKKISDPQNKKHFKFQNEDYQTYDTKYQDMILLNVYLRDETMTLQVNLKEEKIEYIDVARKYVQLLFDTCFLILNKDQYKQKAWQRFDRYVKRQNLRYEHWKEHHTSNVRITDARTDGEVLIDLLDSIHRSRR